MFIPLCVRDRYVCMKLFVCVRARVMVRARVYISIWVFVYACSDYYYNVYLPMLANNTSNGTASCCVIFGLDRYPRPNSHINL